MKKFLFLGALAAMLLGTASCSKDVEPTMGGEVPVSFAINLGDNIDSRTISDGTGANQLKFAVFENGTEIPALAQTVAVADKHATINTKLVKGHTYSFVFWAQNKACTAYNTDDMSAIKVDYTTTTVNCNDETRDAFYKMDSFTVTEPFEKTEVLTRPFAQINFLADDAAGVVGVDAYKSKVTVTGVPTTLNTLDGTVGTETTDVTFDYATLVNETLAGYGSYKYVAMNYILAATEKEVKNEVVLTVNDGTADVNTVTVANCPVQRNYRTNIFGSLFTVEGKFNIEIDPIYAGEYILPEKENVVTMNGQDFESIEAAYNAALEDGLTDIVMTLAKGTYTMDNNFAFENPNILTNVTVQAANGVSASDVIINNSRFAMCSSDHKRVAHGSSMTIKGITFTTNTNGDTKNEGGSNGAYYRSGKTSIYAQGNVNVIVENCIFDLTADRKCTGIFTWGLNGGTTVIKDCVFNGNGDSAGKAIGFSNGASNTVDGCTFNKTRDYAVQVNDYYKNDPINQLIFKNNTVNAYYIDATHPYCGLALDNRQGAFFNLNIIVENNVMPNAPQDAILYGRATGKADQDGDEAWGTVTVNNGKENWGIYVP